MPIQKFPYIHLLVAGAATSFSSLGPSLGCIEAKGTDFPTISAPAKMLPFEALAANPYSAHLCSILQDEIE